MRSWPDDVISDAAPPPDPDDLVAAGRWGDTDGALRRSDALVARLEQSPAADALLLGLYVRAQLQGLAGAPVADTVAACDVLERAAVERRSPVMVATACALRAGQRLDAGDVGAAMADLSRVDLERLADDLDGADGARLLDVLASAYARLRLVERLDEVRARIEESVKDLSPLQRASHWASWALELSGRAMEPIAAGSGEPDQPLLGRAVEVAERVTGLPPTVVPPRLRRTVDGVRALAAAYRGRPSEALRLLGQDAFGDPKDLAALERQVVRLAAMHAHALVGSIATARSLDDAGCENQPRLPFLVLEVCRARERLWLETHAGGDVVPVLHRLTELLVRLGWQGMDLVADTARQALEHQALRAESRTDPLTGAGNRRALDEDLRHILRFTPLPMSLILVDVDDFKGVNDRFTHVIGDEVLRRVAASLSSQLRVGDRLLRYGGDEFVVLLPRTGDQEARQVAARMSDAISELPWAELADGLDVGITTGCAALWSLTGRRPERDAEHLFRRADEALLESKRRRPGKAGATDARGSGRRVALREAPGPTLAPPDRPVERVEEPLAALGPGTDPLGLPIAAAALSGVRGGDPLLPRTPSLGLALPERLGAGLTTSTPPLGQPALVADLLDAAETMDEAVSHVTAPGIPVITGSLPLLPPRHGRRALGPPSDTPSGADEDAPAAPRGGARRPAVIDLDAGRTDAGSGRRAAHRTPLTDAP